MTASRWILTIATVALVAGCQSGPLLPPDEIPADFVFGYEYAKISDMPDVGPAPVPVEAAEAAEAVSEEAAEPEGGEVPEAGGEEMPEEAPAENLVEIPAEQPEGEDGTDGETGGEEVPEAGAEAEEPAEAMEPAEPETPAEPEVRPASMRIEVRATGDVVYVVEYDKPTPSRNAGVLQIDDQTLQKIYDRVREADLASLDDRYVGDDYAAGEETYHVVGSDLREVWIDVYATRVDALTDLFRDVMKLLPERTILVPPAPETKAFLMDRTTAKIHRSTCPQVKELVEAARIPLPTPQAGLNLGGFPCEECQPLSK